MLYLFEYEKYVLVRHNFDSCWRVGLREAPRGQAPRPRGVNINVLINTLTFFSGSLLPFSQLGGGRQGEHVTGTWCCARVLGCCVK
jgi:hypothetical protein